VIRDLLRIELRAEGTEADARTVQSAINRRMAGRAPIRARQVQGVRVETGSYNVGEERPQNSPVRWRAASRLILTGNYADSMLKLAGVLQIGRAVDLLVAYEVSPETVRGAEEDLTPRRSRRSDHRVASIAGHMHLAAPPLPRSLHVSNAGYRPAARCRVSPLRPWRRL